MYSHEKQLNQILLKRRNAVMLDPASKGPENSYKKALVATLGKNIESLGYKLSKSLADELMTQPEQNIIDIAKEIEKTLKERIGADVEYRPMYPNFPESVMARSDVQLYMDALIYAYSDFTILPYDPPAEVAVKEEAQKMSKLKTIELGNYKMVKEIAKNLLSSQVAFSPEDKEDLLEIGKDTDQIRSMIPEKIPNKENLIWLTSEYMDKVSKTNNPFLDKITSAKDIMRLLVTRGGGDPSLTNIGKLKRVSRAEANAYASKIASLHNAEKELYSQRQLFKYIANINHFRNSKDPNVHKLLDRIYNNTMERSFSAQRDQMIKSGDFSGLVNLYASAPGQMGADMTRLVRIAADQENRDLARATLCTSFRLNASKMSTLNLLKIDEALKIGEEERDYNVYSANKGLSNPYMKEETRSPLPRDLTTPIRNIISYELQERYKEKRPLGKVYIEPALKGVKIPSQQRTDSKGSIGLTFGSQFDLKKDTNKIRTFIHWTNKEDRDYIDIDLSATFYNKDFEPMHNLYYGDMVAVNDEVDYDSYRYNSDYDVYAVHSGDMRNGGPKDGPGVAEFIDVDLEKLKKALPDVKYCMFTVNVYAGESFRDTPCKFGWIQDNDSIKTVMEKAKAELDNGDGEFGWMCESKSEAKKLYDESKAERAVDVNANSSRSIPIILDVENAKVIWMDRSPDRSSDRYRINNVLTYSESLKAEALRAVNCSTPNLYTLLSAHAMARADEIVSDPKEADTIFTVDRVDKEEYENASEFLSAYDVDEILGDYLSDQLSDKDVQYFQELHEAEKIAAEEEIVYE